MAQRVSSGFIDEAFEELISNQLIASTIEAMPERYWELIESMMKIAFEKGTVVGVRANPGEIYWDENL
jgi:hypothetical protein